MSDTDFDPYTIVDPPKQPLFSLRRLAILGVVAVAFGVLAITASQGVGGSGDESGSEGVAGCTQLAVAAFTPCPGSRVLRQSAVGVELDQGFDGRIRINGIDVPEEQMQGAILPGSEAYEQLTAEQRQLGPRPNNKNVVQFLPGEGKVVEEFSGQVDITVTYWPVSEGAEASSSFSYVVFVT